MDKIDKLLSDSKLHVDEAKTKIIEWQIKLKERERFLETVNIIKKS